MDLAFVSPDENTSTSNEWKMCKHVLIYSKMSTYTSIRHEFHEYIRVYQSLM